MDSLLHLMEDPNLLSPARLGLLRRVAAAAKIPAYVVGGFGRDLLLKRPVSDFDVVVEGDAIGLASSLAKQYGGKATAHTKFGTAKWFLKDGSFLDLITARSETYTHNAALPSVKFGSLTDDILRRDFTINTLAVRLDGMHFGSLRDDLNGRKDIENGIIRALHKDSFLDDPTRMYRAVRYEQRYGFEIEERTLSLIADGREVINKLSAQRIRHELDLILGEHNAFFMLSRLAWLNLLTPIHPALPEDIPYLPMLYQQDGGLPELWGVGTYLDQNGLFAPSRDFMWLLWLTPLSKDEIESINKRLGFTSELLKALCAASALLSEVENHIGARPSEWVKYLDRSPMQSIAAVYLLNNNLQVQDALYTYLQNWNRIKPALSGADLKARGLPSGPRYNEILWKLRAAWLDGALTNKAEEVELLEKLLEEK